jgi:hypothetical protein
LDVSYEEYYKRLVDQCAFNIACMATVHETNYEYFAQDDFRVRKPDIKIKVGFIPFYLHTILQVRSTLNDSEFEFIYIP